MRVFDTCFPFFTPEFCVFVLEIIYYNVESVFGTPFAPNSVPRQQTTIGWALAVVSEWAEGVRSPMCKAPDPIAVRAATDPSA